MRILITGGKSQIGQCIASARHGLGDKVILTSSHEEHLKNFSDDYQKLSFDLFSPQKSTQDLDKILSEGLDALVLNAATESPRIGPLDQVSWDELTEFLSANINGNMWLLRKVLPTFKEQKFGRIVFVSSLTSDLVFPGYAVYASAKAAMECFVKYVAVEFGAFNINANTIRLGIIKTERNKAFWRRDSLRKKMEDRTSLKRLGEPHEIVSSVNILLETNCYLQGTTIDISGGLHIPL
jgi:NAD(P)-dependent dehydrogenase (short-subunit alcohol dehydrogenase family)